MKEKEDFINHEVRIRILQHISKQTNNKLNALITIAITGLIMPVILKYIFGV